MFRPLRADEVELRVSTCSAKGFSVLLYKDARCDQNILDETVGCMNWQREHKRDNANCVVSIWDKDKKMWVSKEDTGTESFTEKEKGLASDSFKRACFNWGIGRELYTAPLIWISGHTVKDGNRYVPENHYDRELHITELVSVDGVISVLVIKDKSNKTVFSYGRAVAKEAKEDKLSLEELRSKALALAEVKGIPEEEICKMGRVEDLSQFDETRWNKCIEWLKQN